MSSAVRAYQASLFGRSERSDCTITFYLEHQPDGHESDDHPGKRRRTRASTSDVCVLGEPLPAHLCIICPGSARLGAQADRWTAERSRAGSKPDLRVPLGSAEELPHAHTAIRYTYTGTLDGIHSLADVLGLRRLASYLQVEGCVEACDMTVVQLLAPVLPYPFGVYPVSMTGATVVLDGVVALYHCRTLLPDWGSDPGAPALLEHLFRGCRQQLLSYGSAAVSGSVSLGELLAFAFRDAPSVLCNHTARKDLQGLQAAAMEALLSSAGFATDDEASVLLMLSYWRDAQTADKAVMTPLCKQLRLLHLNHAYLYDLLPVLSWVGVSPTELRFLQKYAAAGNDSRKRQVLADAAHGTYDCTSSPWYAPEPRPQTRTDVGRPYGFHLKEKTLHQGLATGDEDGVIQLQFKFGDDFGMFRWANGFRWRPTVEWQKGAAAASVSLECSWPSSFQALLAGAGGALAAAGPGPLRLVVYRKRTEGVGTEEAWRMTYTSFSVKVDEAITEEDALPLAVQGGGEADSDTRTALLSPWSPYLVDGKVTGVMMWE